MPTKTVRAARPKTKTKKSKAKERAEMLRSLEVQWRKEQRLLDRARREVERDARARRYRVAIALARKLYRQGVSRAQIADETGLYWRTVHNHTADIRRWKQLMHIASRERATENKVKEL